MVREGRREASRAILMPREEGVRGVVTAGSGDGDGSKINYDSPGGGLDTDRPGNIDGK